MSSVMLTQTVMVCQCQSYSNSSSYIVEHISYKNKKQKKEII